MLLSVKQTIIQYTYQHISTTTKANMFQSIPILILMILRQQIAYSYSQQQWGYYYQRQCPVPVPMFAEPSQSQTPCTQTCFQTQFRSCKICYRKCAQSLTLLSCVTSICPSYTTYYDRKRDALVQVCQHYQPQYNFTDPVHCMNACCGGGHFNWANVWECQDYMSTGKKIFIIIMGIVLSVCALFGVIFCVLQIDEKMEKRKKAVQRARAMHNA